MKELIKKFRLKLFAEKKYSHRFRLNAKAQSMVEVAVTLPILLSLFLGLVEFGFMLNTYLSLLDATRYAARQYSNSNPLTAAGDSNPLFFSGVADAVVLSLEPADTAARQIPLDPTMDDILVSAISVEVDETADPDVIQTITRHSSPGIFYSKYGNGFTTKYEDAEIEAYMTANGTVPVDSGILIVEINYSYEGVLGISTMFINMFAPDNHIMIYASTIMPLVSVRP